VSYAYDRDRLRTDSGLTLQQPAGGNWVQSYAYDSSWRLSTINSGSFAYSYQNPSAWVSTLQLPNQARIVRTPDPLMRLEETSLQTSSQAVLNSHAYPLYNWANEALSQVRSGQRSDGQSFQNTISYSFDGLGQIGSATGTELSGGQQIPRAHEQFGYGYDPAGNLASRQDNGLVRSISVNNANQIGTITVAGRLTVSGMTSGGATSVTVGGQPATLYQDGTFASAPLALGNSYTATAYRGPDSTSDTISLSSAPAVFQYDDDGNLLSDGLRQFTYDDEDQLVRVEVPGSWAVAYTYDALRRCRIRQEWDGTGNLLKTTRYIYDGMRVIQERDGNNQAQATYIWGQDLSGSLEGAGGIGGLVARIDSGGTTYYHCDGSGNVTALVNADQKVVARYVYDPFGNLLGSEGPQAEANSYRFSSKSLDQTTGLCYYGFRWYDPNLQRWINRDPIGENGGINLYEFVGNDPVKYVDPLGLDIWVGGRGPHQNINVGDPNGTFSSYSFGLDSRWAMLNPLRTGVIYLDDPPRCPKLQYGYLKTTPKEDAMAKAVLDELIDCRMRYGLPYGNCRTFSQDMFGFFKEQFPNRYIKPPEKPLPDMRFFFP
jgi:RHS repeat-associated protein